MNENQKAEERLKSLREEYSNLFSLIQHYYTSPYNVIPIGVTLLGAMAVYGVSEKGSDSDKGLWGVVVCISMVPLMIWQSYIHTLLCKIGVRLVELEYRINAVTGAAGGNGLRWFSSTIGEGYKTWECLKFTTRISYCFFLIVYAISAILGFYELRDKFTLPRELTIAAVIFPLLLMLALAFVIEKAEKDAAKEKEAFRKNLAKLSATSEVVSQGE